MNVLYRNYQPFTLRFAGILMTAAILDSFATLLYLSAIKNGDLSKIIPMLCFIPVTQLFVTPVLIHENLSVPGFFSSLSVMSYYTAIGLGPVAYVSSVRRLGVLFTMMAGIVVLKEGIRPLGFLGGVIMIAGAALISLFG